MTHPRIENLTAALTPARQRVLTHPLYSSLDSKVAVHTFMEHHVFAVWDFMSLLTSLQRDLTCTSLPWIPKGPRGTRRLINDIVLAEESDEIGSRYLSHFELYVDAMSEAGADHSTVERFVDLIASGSPVADAMRDAAVPGPAARFVDSTWGLVQSASVHCRAAAFAFGREDLIPEMFSQVVAVNRSSGGLDTFVDYLERHIEIDGGEHSPMAMQMLVDLCGDDDDRWRECLAAAEAAMQARFELWDGIVSAINGNLVGRAQSTTPALT